MNKISIIIPILNESKTIVSLLQYLIINSSSTNISEIIVVDGGSKDESFKLVSDFNLLNDKVILISSDRGRATQMNLGKQKATGTILYFLHADSFPPNGFDQLIINEVKKGNLAGCFKMKFNPESFIISVNQAESVTSICVHVTIRRGYSSFTHGNCHLMKGLR